MCDDQLDKDGYFTLLVIRGKYSDKHPNAMQLKAVIHRSKHGRLAVLKMCADELNINIQELEKDKQ